MDRLVRGLRRRATGEQVRQEARPTAGSRTWHETTLLGYSESDVEVAEQRRILVVLLLLVVGLIVVIGAFGGDGGPLDATPPRDTRAVDASGTGEITRVQPPAWLPTALPLLPEDAR